MDKNGRHLVGRCGVDSGQLLIIDPCYLSEWKHGDMDGDYDEDKPMTPAKNNYDECCKVTLSQDAGPVLRNLAVVSNTGWGDGNYPVYATWKHGRIVKLEVDFENEDEEDGDNRDS